jgi:hypothetical protein
MAKGHHPRPQLPERKAATHTAHGSGLGEHTQSLKAYNIASISIQCSKEITSLMAITSVRASSAPHSCPLLLGLRYYTNDFHACQVSSQMKQRLHLAASGQPSFKAYTTCVRCQDLRHVLAWGLRHRPAYCWVLGSRTVTGPHGKSCSNKGSLVTRKLCRATNAFLATKHEFGSFRSPSYTSSKACLYRTHIPARTSRAQNRTLVHSTNKQATEAQNRTALV